MARCIFRVTIEINVFEGLVGIDGGFRSTNSEIAVTEDNMETLIMAFKIGGAMDSGAGRD